MKYTVKVQKKFKALQGLESPIRHAKGLPALQPVDGYDTALHITIAFDESQLGKRGWFVDTDGLDDAINAITGHLSSAKWTDLFDFRPTFELVARWVYQELEPKVPQLISIELENQTIGTMTKYSKT